MADDCADYKPGTKQGKNGPVCAYYERYLNGVCTHQRHLMCSRWVERWLKDHPVQNVPMSKRIK